VYTILEDPRCDKDKVKPVSVKGPANIDNPGDLVSGIMMGGLMRNIRHEPAFKAH
jgi:hypothetical protein